MIVGTEHSVTTGRFQESEPYWLLSGDESEAFATCQSRHQRIDAAAGLACHAFQCALVEASGLHRLDRNKARSSRTIVFPEVTGQSGSQAASPADEERAAFLMHEISRDNPLRKHLIEATQLVKSVVSTARPLQPADKSQLIASLTLAGENKIGLFAAMCQIAKDAQA